MPATRRSRALAFALTALFVAGQAALFTHQLLVPHQVCAEHDGELIHVEAAVQTTAIPSSPAYAHAQSPQATHGHEHCSAVTVRREDTVAPAQPCEIGAAVRSEVATVSCDAQRSIPRSVLLRLAPKNSPPV